jgi:hypothetical protein
MVYGVSLQGVRLGESLIYRGVFASGLFQCVYQPGAAHWAMVPSTLEWHVGAAAIALVGLLWMPALFVALGMLALSLLLAALQAAQARLPAKHRGLSSRVVVAGLCYSQPLVRSWARYRTRFFHPRVIVSDDELPDPPTRGLSLICSTTAEYWSEKWLDRTQLLDAVVAYLTERRWTKEVGGGWEPWDLILYCHPLADILVRSVQEDHGSGRRLLRIRFTMRAGTTIKIAGTLGLAIAAILGVVFGGAVGFSFAAFAASAIGTGWWSAARSCARAVAVFDHAAKKLGLYRCSTRTEHDAIATTQGAT